VRNVIKKLKGQLPGVEARRQWVCQNCNPVWNSGVVPADWKDDAVIGISKKGNVTGRL